jgi:hypothetical protein
MKTFGTAALASLAFQSAQAHLGVDVSTRVGDWGCFKKAGYDFAIPRAWLSFGAPDPNANYNIAKAHEAGISKVDVYMFPCRGKSATAQADGFANSIKAQNRESIEVTDDISELESANGMEAGLYDDVVVNEEILDESAGEHL